MTFIVGVPRCNEPHEIFATTLAAIRANTIKPIAVVVIDNGDEELLLTEQLWPTSFVDFPLVIDHPGRNIGCAGAWNRIRAAARIDAIIINADCEVPPDTFERMLEYPSPVMMCAFGFGCFRLDKEIYEKVGRFDEAFYPVYFEDADYRYRLKLAGIPIVEWEFKEKERLTFGRARYTTGFAHGWRHDDGRGYQGWTDEKLAWFYKRWEHNRDRFITKWGGLPGEEKFAEPFDGKGEPL